MRPSKIKNYSKPKRVKTVYGGGKKHSEENIVKSRRNVFKLKKKNQAIKGRIITDIRTLFKQGDDHCKPIRVGVFRNNDYIEYDSSCDRNKNLSVK